jgi:hypothetical protein
VEETKRGGKQVKEHLVKYISYINNILVKVKLMELIELKVGSWERVGGSGRSVATRCPANGLLGLGARRAHAPNKVPGPYA